MDLHATSGNEMVMTKWLLRGTEAMRHGSLSIRMRDATNDATTHGVAALSELFFPFLSCGLPNQEVLKNVFLVRYCLGSTFVWATTTNRHLVHRINHSSSIRLCDCPELCQGILYLRLFLDLLIFFFLVLPVMGN